MIEVSERTRGIWYVTMPPGTDDAGHGGDWMAHVEQLAPDRFRIVWRFRYYTGGREAFNDDRKNWWEGIVEGTETKALDAMHAMAELTKAYKHGDMWELLRGTGTIDAFMAQFAKLPFVHLKRMNAEEFAKMEASGDFAGEVVDRGEVK